MLKPGHGKTIKGYLSRDAGDADHRYVFYDFRPSRSAGGWRGSVRNLPPLCSDGRLFGLHVAVVGQFAVAALAACPEAGRERMTRSLHHPMSRSPLPGLCLTACIAAFSRLPFSPWGV